MSADSLMISFRVDGLLAEKLADLPEETNLSRFIRDVLKQHFGITDTAPPSGVEK